MTIRLPFEQVPAGRHTTQKFAEQVTSSLTAHRHILGYVVPYTDVGAE